MDQRARAFALASLIAGTTVAAAQITLFGPRCQLFGPFPYRALSPTRPGRPGSR